MWSAIWHLKSDMSLHCRRQKVMHTLRHLHNTSYMSEKYLHTQSCIADRLMESTLNQFNQSTCFWIMNVCYNYTKKALVLLEWLFAINYIVVVIMPEVKTCLDIRNNNWREACVCMQIIPLVNSTSTGHCSLN